jgi:CBS domain-containing protein
MAQDVAVGHAKTTVEEARAIMCSRDVSGIPVIDEQHHIIGVFSTSDIPDDPAKRRAPIRDYMRTPAITVDEDAPIEDVAALMSINGINRIPVTREGNLIGIIARDDIIRYVATRRAWPETEPHR